MVVVTVQGQGAPQNKDVTSKVKLQGVAAAREDVRDIVAGADASRFTWHTPHSGRSPSHYRPSDRQKNVNAHRQHR